MAGVCSPTVPRQEAGIHPAVVPAEAKHYWDAAGLSVLLLPLTRLCHPVSILLQASLVHMHGCRLCSDYHSHLLSLQPGLCVDTCFAQHWQQTHVLHTCRLYSSMLQSGIAAVGLRGCPCALLWHAAGICSCKTAPYIVLTHKITAVVSSSSHAQLATGQWPAALGKCLCCALSCAGSSSLRLVPVCCCPAPRLVLP